MNRTTRRLALFAGTLALAFFGLQDRAMALSGTFYVSTAGSDSNSGSQAAPWRTIQHAANVATAGSTVFVLGGVYNEAVTFPNSGTASAPIVFQSYPGQTAVIDGTGVKCCGTTGTQGLVTISGNLSYITISGFEIRNFTTSTTNNTPAGVWVVGSGTGVRILNNIVHDITTKSEKRGDAFGISVYGTSKTPITQLVISGNEVYDLKTGQSESVNVCGNVTYFAITNNLVHDNDNIGIVAIGYENVGPVGYDQAMFGEIAGNTVYNISGITNKGEGSSYDADGLYCDGCAYVTYENNWVFNTDLGIEVTSENQICLPNGTEWTGPGNTGSAQKGTSPCYGRYVTVRNNVFANSANAGMSIGGAKAATKKGGEETTGGSTLDAVFVNNTLYNNVKVTANSRASSPGGEIQIQHQIGSGQGNYFENNLVYAGPWNHWIYSFVKASSSYPAPPATDNWNLYYSAAGYVEKSSVSWADVDDYANFAAFQSQTGEDANSLPGVNPQVGNVTSAPWDLDIASTSPAANAGSLTLTCSIAWCDPNGTSPNSPYGATDFLGAPRTNGSTIAIGAYETTNALTNTVAVSLTASLRTLQTGGSTTLYAVVSAVPGGGGVPSGTVTFYDGNTAVGTQTLVPAGVTVSTASLPLSASQMSAGSNAYTAVYSGNTIATGCCSPSSPPSGGVQEPNYPSATSNSTQIVCRSLRPRGWSAQPSRRGTARGRPGSAVADPC
jgi:hypothetical protein